MSARLLDSLTLEQLIVLAERATLTELPPSSPASELYLRIKAAEIVLVKIVEYQQVDPTVASAHCMRRSVEAAINILRGVQL